jgi:hypothetical protein
MYTDLYLKFESEEQADSLLYTVHPAVDNEQEYATPNYINIDVLGILYERQEIDDPENPPEPVPLDGWHVNVRVMPFEDPTLLEAFKVNPEPQVWRRVWA